MYHNFGSALRNKRLEGGFSLRALARRVGVNFTYLSKLENGVLPPPASSTIHKLAKILKQSPDVLMRLAGKLPQDLSAILLEDENVPNFLRAANRQRLSRSDWEELAQYLNERRPKTLPGLAGSLRDSFLVDRLIERLSLEVPQQRQLVFLEMCGMNGHRLVRAALGNVLDGKLRVDAGPSRSKVGTTEFLKRVGLLAQRKDVRFLMCAEPTLEHSVHKLATRNRNLPAKIISSPQQAVLCAASEPEIKFVFLTAGFETTVPSVSISVLEAHRRRINNLFFLTSLRSMTAGISAAARENKRSVHGVIAPGHVSAITGLHPFREIARSHRLPIVVAGFEIADILHALLMLVRQVQKGQARVENQYERAVPEEGNPAARQLMMQVFALRDGTWEGLGRVTRSVFSLRPAYRYLAAEALLN